MVELCVITWWKYPDVTYRCIEKLSNPLSTVQSEVHFTIEMYIGILFILCAGILGAIIVELLYNKSDYFLTPLVNRVVRRYRYTIQRNRYRTMNGHP